MARNLLADADVRTSTCLEGKRIAKLFDGEGLELWVSPIKRKPGRPRKGAASVQFVRRWRFSYRFAGKRNSLSVGTYPTVSLATARDKVEELRRQIAAGEDPAARRKADKRALEHAAANTFNAIADEWLAKQRALDGKHARAEVSLAKLTWLLDLVRPDIGELSVGEISPMQCLAALKKIEKRGRFDTARRCRSTMSRVFKMAMATGRAASDPTSALIGDDVLTPPAGKNRAAITDPTLFGRLLRDVETYHGAPETRLALKLLALTALRPGELRQLRWSWIGESAGQRAICIPAGMMKMRKEHRVPLSTQAAAIVEELRALSGWSASDGRTAANADFIFPCSQPRRVVGKDGKPSKRPLSRPMSEGALGSALKRLGYESTVHVPHGFRSSFSTIANEASVSEPHVVEAALAHVTTGVAGDYNRANLLGAARDPGAVVGRQVRRIARATVAEGRGAAAGGGGVVSSHPRHSVGGRKRGRPRKLDAKGRSIKNRPGSIPPEMIAEGWMHGGMVDDVDREWRRKPNPTDDELALVAEMLDASTTLYAFVDLVHAVGGAAAEEEISTVLRAQAVEIRRRREQGEDVTIPELDPTLALIFGSQAGVQVLVAGCAERHRPRKPGEKIIRPDFGDDAVGLARFECGLNFRRAPHRPKDSAAEVARKIKLRGQEGAADVRYRARKRLPK